MGCTCHTLPRYGFRVADVFEVLSVAPCTPVGFLWRRMTMPSATTPDPHDSTTSSERSERGVSLGVNGMCSNTVEPATDPVRLDFSFVFPPDPVWVRTAREAVRTALGTARGPDGELVGTALLLTSEAVTNAVLACRISGCAAPVTLYAHWSSTDWLRVLVCDDAPGFPVARQAESAGWEEHGRGLLLIRKCAADWGVCRHRPGPGKAVWFELGEPRSPRPQRSGQVTAA